MTIQQLEEMSQQYLTGSEERVMPSGYKQTDVGIIPLDWQSIHLGEIAEVKMCKRILSAQTSKTGPIPFFKIGTFGGESDAFISQSLYDEFKAKYSFPEMGDVLISAAGTLGKTVIYDGKPSYFQDSNIVWLKVDKTKILNEYLYHYYRVIKWASSEGSTISRLYNGIIRASLVSLPPLQEQIAIANALSDVDALITELKKLITKKQAIKTATMQQLLTGRTRLPQFALCEDGSKKGYKPSELGEIPEDWEVVQLSSCSELITKGTTPMTIGRSFVDQGITFVKVESINEHGEFEVSKFAYIDNQTDQLLARSRIKEGDLLISIAGALGRAAIATQKILPANTNQALAIVRLKNNSQLVASYLYHFTKTSVFKKSVEEIASQGAQPNLSLSDLGAFNIIAPKIDEQIAISTVLSDMEEKLQSLEQRLSKTCQIKQGMMQELLMGKIRLVKPEGDHHDSA